MFYAAEYAYGATTINRGYRPNRVMAFSTATDADTWVGKRATDYPDHWGYRDRIPATHRYVRQWQRINHRDGGPHGKGTIEAGEVFDVYDG